MALYKIGAITTSCEAQQAAACFTMYAKLLSSKTDSCGPTFGMCRSQRDYVRLNQAADVDVIDECHALE